MCSNTAALKHTRPAFSQCTWRSTCFNSWSPSEEWTTIETHNVSASLSSVFPNTDIQTDGEKLNTRIWPKWDYLFVGSWPNFSVICLNLSENITFCVTKWVLETGFKDLKITVGLNLHSSASVSLEKQTSCSTEPPSQRSLWRQEVAWLSLAWFGASTFLLKSSWKLTRHTFVKPTS